MLVPEHEVKALLTERGVPVPRGRAVRDLDELAAAARELRPPLVLKGHGPGLVHKSRVGAVRLGLQPDDVVAAAQEMATRLELDGWLVEEQAPPGVEVIVGVVERPPFGHVAAVGLGGVLTEVLDEVVLRLCPITAADAAAMVAGFRGHEVLAGLDTGALAEAVFGIVNTAHALGAQLSELECNPVIVHERGVVAVDARMLTSDDPQVDHEPPPYTDFGPLFAPRSIAVAGASTSRVTFGNTFLQAYREVGWTDGLYAIHPEATEIEGVAAYPSVADVPGPVDYVACAVPAARCADLVRSTAGRTQFVQVISGGFRESGNADAEAELVAAAREAGVRVVGPNCIGTYSPAGRQVFQKNAPTIPGHVGIVSQSGGLAGDVIKAGAVRGLRISKLATVGNSVDVTPGEVVEHLVHDDATHLVGVYLEDPRDGRRLYEAFRHARGHKPVVVLPGGLTAQGGGAAASHTGALTSDRRVWDAISAESGVSVVQTFEDLLAALVYLQRWWDAPAGGTLDTLVVGVGGGATVLGADAADRAGLALTEVVPAGQEALRGLGYGVGTSLRNPVEVGFGPVSDPDVLNVILDPVLAQQPFPDAIVHANVQAFFSYQGGGIDALFPIIETFGRAAWPQTRTSLVLRNLEVAPPEVAGRIVEACVAVGLPAYRTFDEACCAVAAAKRFARARADG